MRVVGEERGAARGVAAGDDPVVRAHAAAGRRDRQEGVRHGASESGVELRSQQFRLPVVRQVPRQEGERRCERPRVLRHGRLQIEQLVLDRGRGHRVDPGVDAGTEPPVHRVVELGPGPGSVALAGAVETDRAREHVVVVGQLAEDLGQPTGGGAQEQLELEEALARGHDALREPEVLEARRGDARSAPAVALDGDGRREPGQGYLAIHREQGRFGHGAELVGHRGSLPAATRARCRASCCTAPRTGRPRARAARASPPRPAGPRRRRTRGRRLPPLRAGARS